MSLRKKAAECILTGFYGTGELLHNAYELERCVVPFAKARLVNRSCFGQPFFFFFNNALIFLANILCVHVRKSDEMYASPTQWCTQAKKKKKKTRPK